MGPQWPICPKQNLFGTNHYYYYFFDLTIGPFHLAKFKKKSYSGSRAMRMRQFWAQNGPFAPNKHFLEKKLSKSFSSTYWSLSLCKISKSFLKRIQNYCRAPFLGPKWPICPNGNFFAENLLKILVPFIHAYLYAKSQSQILNY